MINGQSLDDGTAHFLKEEKVGSCVMSENINGETFPVSHGGVSLPFEWYSKEYILKELTNKKSYFGDIIEIKNATKKKIKSCRKGKNEYFAYIKFFSINGKSYGIVAGKTNYSNPDLLFDDWKDKKDHRYARIFLKNTSDAAWSDTIIIVNHKPSASEEVNCTPFVRQYDILSNKWGVLLCQREYQTNDIRRNSKNW